ncbi:glucose 1-dehydrogenase [Penaeicola halotolerans]|uniref:glucose 1-dehydrogenase n=1 Tax=Penaeicola halotolerans TaxID=2793196 RepID=UPI001CF8117D|nr:glucose 1-dehydrogenase [Penaeicola halotolerans]
MNFQTLFDLKGKVALITGASKGIGEAAALFLAQAGAKVVVSSRKIDAVKAVAEKINQSGGEAYAIACNVGDMEDARKLVSDTIAHFGTIDIIINNAATNPVFGPVHDTSEEAFDKIMAVNVKGPFEIAKAAYPTLKAKKSGSIINISSVGGISPEHGLGIYSMSKAALISLSKVLAKEWGDDNIRVNTICPGLIKTKFSEALWTNDKVMQMMMKALPIKRIGTPEEVAALCLYLAADASAYSTGAVFTADGGFTI